jgi:uncharacterized protein (TIGR02284 family)
MKPMGHGKNLLKYVVDVLYDSEKGLAELGRCMRDAQFATFFKHESGARGAYARRLEMTASLLDAVTEENSARHYWEFMAVDTDDSDETLLAIARQGEEVATKVYHNALAERSLAPAVRRLLEKQQSHIEICGRLVGSFRALKAA